MSVHVYRWDDAVAPVLTSNGPGAMANLLRKCLVDGYGTGAEEKLPAGWSMDWDSTSNAKIALLPAALEAQNCHYYVDDTGTIGVGGNRWARIWMIENWAGFDANNDPTGTLIPSDMTWGRTMVKNSTDADTTAVPWMIFATGSGFYLLADYYEKAPNMDGFRAPVLQFFGRAINYAASDDYLDTTMGSGWEDYTSSYPAYNGPMMSPDRWNSGDAAHAAVARTSPDGGTTGVSIGTRCGAGGANDIENYCGHIPSIPYPDPITGGLLTCRVLLTDADPRQADTAIRGHLPGLLWPLHDTPLPPFSETTIDGRTYIALRISVDTYYSGQALIDTTGPWE